MSASLLSAEQISVGNYCNCSAPVNASTHPLLGAGNISWSILLDDSQQLQEAGVTNGSTVFIGAWTLHSPAYHVVVAVPEALQSTFGPTMSVTAGTTSSTVGQVRTVVVDALGLSGSCLSLNFNGTGTDASTLASLGVPDGGVLNASLHCSVPSTAFIVVVVLPSSLRATHGASRQCVRWQFRRPGGRSARSTFARFPAILPCRAVWSARRPPRAIEIRGVPRSWHEPSRR